MYCPHTILINNRVLFVMLHTTGDYNWKRQIPLTNWLNPRRYEITLFPHTRWRTRINSRAA